MDAAGVSRRKQRHARLNVVALGVFWAVIAIAAFLLLAKSV